jgi:hypothetical protein
LGIKSNRKYLSRQAREQVANENNRWKYIAYSIILPATGLFIWSFVLLDKTFIKTAIVLSVALFSGLLGTAILTTLWRQHNFPFWAILFYGMFSGASISVFLLSASNYYLRDSKTFQEQLHIVKTGNRTKQKSACRTPYAIIVYENIEKEMPLPCEYEKTISTFKKIRLELSEGPLGFDVIQNKELVP